MNYYNILVKINEDETKKAENGLKHDLQEDKGTQHIKITRKSCTRKLQEEKMDKTN